MATQKTLELIFSTELNKTYRMRVYDPKENISSEEVGLIMDNIINKNIFITNGGELTGKLGAKMITRQTEDIDFL